jgi:hypothetical protein
VTLPGRADAELGRNDPATTVRTDSLTIVNLQLAPCLAPLATRFRKRFGCPVTARRRGSYPKWLRSLQQQGHST